MPQQQNHWKKIVCINFCLSNRTNSDQGCLNNRITEDLITPDPLLKKSLYWVKQKPRRKGLHFNFYLFYWVVTLIKFHQQKLSHLFILQGQTQGLNPFIKKIPGETLHPNFYSFYRIKWKTLHQIICLFYRTNTGAECTSVETCGTGQIWYERVSCDPSHANLSDCLAAGAKLSTQTDHSKDTIVSCGGLLSLFWFV